LGEAKTEERLGRRIRITGGGGESEDRRAGSEGRVEVLSEEGFAALRSEQGKT
jgi:hypothetical protein